MQAGAGSDKEMEMSEIIRLDKYLADMGCGTRSQVKQLIRKGQVEINGEKIKKPEQKITTAQDRVCVAGKEIRYEKYRYYLLHKPAGYVSATTDNRDKTVLELLPENIRRELFPVGRPCTRGTIDEPIAIDAVKRFIAERDLHADTRYVPPIVVPASIHKNGWEEKIAIIGGGPAGLSCAFMLTL